MADLLRSLLFRSVLVYTAIFAVAVTLVFGLLYGATIRLYEREADEQIANEARGFQRELSELSSTEIVRMVRLRIRFHREGEALLLVTERLEYVAGNIHSWPAALGTGTTELAEVPYDVDGDGADDPDAIARVQPVTLASGHRLLIGETLEMRKEFERMIRLALIATLAVTLAVGIGGGGYISHGFLGRLDRINRSSQAILEGDIGRRMPVGDAGDELDVLAAQLNRMLDRIELLMRGMREVADNVAHDMRSPLTRLRGRIELALMRPADADQGREVLRRTIEEIDRMLEVFNSLLTIAVAESGADRDRFTRFDLARVAQTALELYEPLAEEAGLRLELATPERLELDGDADLIGRALANLLENAVKYVPRGGHVRVEVERRGSTARLVVSDNGPGIPESDRKRVVERFARLDDSRTAPGSGLGLSLVRAVATLHEGRLTLEDNRPGLRVSLELPIHTRPALA